MDPEVGRWRATKDRRRWCKGHPGRLHVWGEWADKYPGHVYISRLKWSVDERRCERCGKKETRTIEKPVDTP